MASRKSEISVLPPVPVHLILIYLYVLMKLSNVFMMFTCFEIDILIIPRYHIYMHIRFKMYIHRTFSLKIILRRAIGINKIIVHMDF